jgi:hypothetical protein
VSGLSYYEEHVHSHPALWWLRRRWKNADLLRKHIARSHQWVGDFASSISDDAVRVEHWREHRKPAPYRPAHVHRRSDVEEIPA